MTKTEKGDVLMYQVKILHANQIDLLEELINMWLKEQQEVEVLDLKFHSNAIGNGMTEYLAVMIYQQQG